VVSAGPRVFQNGLFFTLSLVLPPVSTTGLKTQDVSDLAVRVRNLMVEALYDISAKAPAGQLKKAEEHLSASAPEKVTPQLSEAQFPQKIPVVEENVGSLTMSSSTSSLHTWQSGTSEYGAETEEDEGMILVGRPA
jgi:lysophosphatidate acyltransferase